MDHDHRFHRNSPSNFRSTRFCDCLFFPPKLPEPHAANAGRLLREYVALRIQVHRETQFSQRCAKAALTYMKASGMKRLPRPQNSRRPLRRVSLPASMRLLIWKRRALPPSVTMCLVPSGCCCCAWRVVVMWLIGWEAGMAQGAPVSCAISVAASHRRGHCADCRYRQPAGWSDHVG